MARLSRILTAVFLWSGLVVLAIGLYKAVIPLLAWSKTARWHPETALQALRGFGLEHTGLYRWLIAPHSWRGLHRLAIDVANWPAFVFYLFAGFLLLLGSDVTGPPERGKQSEAWH